MKKVLIVLCMLFIFPFNVHAEDYRSVEIFDITQGQVVKEVSPSSQIQGLAKNYLKGIKGLYCKFDPIPKNGFAVRIPLDPPVKALIRNGNADIDEVIVMFPEHERPFLMLFKDDTNLLCYNFEGNTASLLKLIHYEPENAKKELRI